MVSIKRGPKSRAGLKPKAVHIVRCLAKGQEVFFLTCLHTKSSGESHEEEEKCDREKTLGGGVIATISRSKHNKGQNGSSEEFGEEGGRSTHVIKLNHIQRVALLRRDKLTAYVANRPAVARVLSPASNRSMAFL